MQINGNCKRLPKKIFENYLRVLGLRGTLRKTLKNKENLKKYDIKKIDGSS